MLVGVPKETKSGEFRVGLTPASVSQFASHGHTILVEANAGAGIGYDDDEYRLAGADIAAGAGAVFGAADMIVKVKEPLAPERQMLRADQILFTYLHLAADRDQTIDLVNSGAVCIAYETVTDAQGRLPLLAPMSQVAGRLSIQAGAHSLEKAHGGAGILLGGVPGVPPAKVLVIGGGVVGENAVEIALGMGAEVVVLDLNVDVLARLRHRFGAALKTVYATDDATERYLLDSDLVVGAVLVPGAAAPKLVTSDQVERMKPGAVLVDVAIDQGGCFQTSVPTTHEVPTYTVAGVVHYCVANMPSAVPRTATQALNNVTLPFGLAIADKGYERALAEDPHLLRGLNVCKGRVTNGPVARHLGYDCVEPTTALAA